MIKFSSYTFISHHVGVAMKAKILDRHEQSRAVLTSATALSTSFKPLAEQIQLERQLEETKRQRMEIDSLDAQRAADEQTSSTASSLQQEEAARQHDEQVKAQHQLRLKAETSRCRRKYLTGILRQLIMTLNDHRLPRGEAAVVAAVTRLQVACNHTRSSYSGNHSAPSSSSSATSSVTTSTLSSPYHTALHTVVTLLGMSMYLFSHHSSFNTSHHLTISRLTQKAFPPSPTMCCSDD